MLMHGSCHLDRLLNVEIGVEFQINLVPVFFKFCCEMHFGTSSRSRKGLVISLQKLQSNLSFFLVQ